MSGGGSNVYELEILTKFDTSSFKSYITALKQGLAELDGLAAGAGGAAPLPPQEVVARAGAIQSNVDENSANIRAAAASGRIKGDTAAYEIDRIQTELAGMLGGTATKLAATAAFASGDKSVQAAVTELNTRQAAAMRAAEQGILDFVPLSPAAQAIGARRAEPVAEPVVAGEANANARNEEARKAQGVADEQSTQAAQETARTRQRSLQVDESALTRHLRDNDRAIIARETINRLNAAEIDLEKRRVAAADRQAEADTRRLQEISPEGRTKTNQQDALAFKGAKDYEQPRLDDPSRTISYVDSVVERTTALRALSALEKDAYAADEAYLTATNAEAIAIAKRATRESASALEAGVPAAQGVAAGQKAIFDAQEALAKSYALQILPGGGAKLAEAQGAAAASLKIQAAATEKATNAELAGNAEYIPTLAANAEANRARAAAVKEASLKLQASTGGEATTQLEITNTLLQRAAAEREKLIIAQTTLADNNGEIGLIAARKATEQALNIVLEERVKEEQKGINEARIANGEKALKFGGGGGGGSAGGIFPTLFGGGGLGGAAELAGSLIAFQAGFKLVSALSEAIKTAEALDQQLVIVQQSAIAIGQGDQFAGFRDSILATSAATGVAGADVATLAQEFLGLYGNVAQASIATDSAAKLIRVIGGTAAAEGPQIAALAQDLNASVNSIGNAVLNIQDSTGRSGKDALAALGQLSPVANELGLNLSQAAGLVKAVGEGSAKSGQQIGEGLARILPTLTKDIPKLARDGITFDIKARNGDAVHALQDLITKFPLLDPTQKQAVVQDLGGPRNAQILAAAFADPDRALKAFNSTLQNSNLLNERNAAAQDTLKGALDRLKTTLTSLGENLLHSGLLDFFKVLAGLAGGVITVLNDVVGAFARLNKDTGGILGTLTTLVGALVLLQKFKVISFVVDKVDDLVHWITSLDKIKESIVGKTVATNIDTAATRTNALAQAADTGVVGTEAVAENTLAAAELRQAAAKELTGLNPGLGGLGGAGGAAGAAGEAAAGGAVAGEAAAAAAPAAATVTSSGGALAAVGGPITLAIAAAAAIAITVGSLIKKSTDKKVKDLLTAYDTASDEQLSKAVKDNSKVDVTGDRVRRVASDILGNPLTDPIKGVNTVLNALGVGIHVPDVEQGALNLVFGKSAGNKTDLAQQVVRARHLNQQSDEFNALIQAKAGTPTQQKALADALADPGNADKFHTAETAFVAITGTIKGKAADDQFRALVKTQAALNGMTTAAGETFSNAKDIVSAFQAGDVDYETAINDLDVLIGSESGSANDVQRNKDITTKVKLVSAQALADVNNQVAFSKDVLEQSPKAQIDILLRSLTGVTGAKLSVGDKEKIADQITKADKAQTDYQLAHAHSIQEIDRIQKEGQTVDSATAGILNDQDIAQGLTPRYAEFQKLRDARQAEVNKRHRALLHAGERQGTKEQVAAGQADFSVDDLGVPDLPAEVTTALGDDTFAKGQADKVALLDKQFAMQSALAKNAGANTVALQRIVVARDAQIVNDLQSADAATGRNPADDVTLQAELLKQVTDAGTLASDILSSKEALVASQFKLQEALAKAAGNPLGAAAIGLQGLEANLALLESAPGGGDPAKINDATAAIVTARAALQQQQVAAAQSIIQGQFKLQQAQATASGNPNLASQLAIQSLQAQLSSLQSQPGQGGDPGKLLDLQAQIVTAQAASIQGQITNGEALIQTDLSLHRIGIAGAITRLNQLKQLATNQTQADQIQLQINSLLNSTQQGLQFDLPANIRLPTLYEARRAAGTGGVVGNGSQYQDNRNVQITLVAPDANSAAQQVLSSLNSAPVYGNNPRGY